MTVLSRRLRTVTRREGTAFKNVLVASDFSPCSEGALRHGLGIARRYGSHVYLMNVVYSLGYHLAGPNSLVGAVNLAWRDAQRLETDLLLDGTLDGIRFETLIETGPPAETIASIAAQRHIDLVVLGTHGRNGVGKLVLGSCAEKVFRTAPCAVLTVGNHIRRPKVPDEDKTRVLLVTDFTAESERAAAYATSIAGRTHTLPFVLHVADELVGAADGERELMLKRMRSHVRDWFLSTQNCAPPPAIVEVGSPSDVILDVAVHVGADLIVMGVHARTPFYEFLTWPVAYKIVCGATCPVLTVRNFRDAAAD